MIVQNQDAVVDMLKDPATYGEAGPVETIETHISRIFLVGQRAFKMKRAVKLPYQAVEEVHLRAMKSASSPLWKQICPLIEPSGWISAQPLP